MAANVFRSPFIEGETACFLIMAVTALYFGISLITARAVPLIGAILVTLYPLAGFSPGGQFFSQAVFGIGIIWIGVAVYRANANERGMREVSS